MVAEPQHVVDAVVCRGQPAGGLEVEQSVHVIPELEVQQPAVDEHFEAELVA